MSVAINTNNRPLRVFLWFILLFYLAVLTKLIIFKRPLGYIKRHFLQHFSWQLAKANMHKANLKPFTTIKLYLNSHGHAEYAINNLLGNIIGFIPLGLLLPLLFRRLRSGAVTIFCVLIFSLAFETFQLFSMLGIFDVDDLLLNTLGGAIGYLLFLLIAKWIDPR